MKNTDLKKKLPDVFSIMQEVKLRFKMTHDVFQRFFKSSKYLRSLFSTLDKSNTLKILDSITKEDGVNNADVSLVSMQSVHALESYKA